LRGKKEGQTPRAQDRAKKEGGRGTHQKDKPPIIGMVSRETDEVVIAPSTDVTGEDILGRAVKNVEPEALVYHDDFRSYGVLDGIFNHQSVNHSAGEYARGDVHTNTIEGEFSILRPWLSVFRGVSKEKLFLYCAQFQLLRSIRAMDMTTRAVSLFGVA